MLFDATVNTAGLKEGAAITVRNGAIVIEAAGDAVLGGTIQASGAADHDAGSVTVTAGNDVTISGDARLAAAGGGDGSNAGSVLIKAGHDLGVEQGAVANVHGKDGGNGGTVELSAAGTGSFTGATLDAGSDRGAAGSILIDPSSVVIGGGAPTNYPSDTPTIPSTIPSIASNGANVTVTADTSIVIASNGYINTRKTAGTGNDKTSLSTGNSGDVTLNAPGIQVFGEINSFALNTTGAGASTWTDGKITLNASLSEHGQAGHTFANTGIDIYGVLNGGVIDLEANATARTEYDTVAAVFVDLAESLFGVGAGYVKSTTNAAINIYSGAHVTGSGDVTLNAWTNTVAKDPVYNVSLLTFMSLTGGLAVPSVVVGDVNATTTAHIGSGATVSSGGALTVRAHSSDDLEVSTFTVTTSVPIDASVAYSTADIQSNALIDSGATITANSLRVAARNDNSFNTSVSVYDLGDGNAGIAVAIADGHHAQATANLGASPTLNGTFAANAGPQVLVEAENSTTADAVLATATVGTTKLLRPIVNAVQGAVQALQNRIGGKVSDASGSDKTKTPKFGASVAVSLDNRQGSSASIAGSDSAHAPTITATGPVAVVAHTFDTGVRSEGASGINAPDSKQGTAQDPSSTIAVSAGVAYAERTLTADAEIGTAVHITAPEIGVLATTDLPIDVTWLDWDSFNAVLAHANGSLGLGKTVLTSFASATADAGSLGFTGAVNYFAVTANTTAWVGKGAVLTATTPNATLPWTLNIDSGNDGSLGAGGPSDSFATAVDIEAHRHIDVLNFGGDPLFFYGGTNGGGAGASVFGGTFDLYKTDGMTLAGVAAYANVSTGGDLKVSVEADDRGITISPAGGNGAGFNGDIIEGVNLFGASAHASISNLATISAGDVLVNAHQIMSLWSASGAIVRGNETSIGIALALNAVISDVAAIIGDNSADDPSQALPAGFVASVPGVTATNVSVKATTEGQIGTYGLAGAFTSNSNSDEKGGMEKILGAIGQAFVDLVTKAGSKLGFASGAGAKSGDNANNSNNGKDGAQGAKGGAPGLTPKFGESISGSITATYVQLNTLANIDGATITHTTGAPDGTVDVTAKRDTSISTFAGGASYVNASASTSKENTSVAGSLAMVISQSQTSSKITNSVVNKFQTVSVQAVSGGDNTAVAVDIAGNFSSTQGSQNYTGAGAVSLADIDDGVNATIDTSIVDGPATGTGREVIINAYERTDIGVGGGALYLKFTKQNGGSGGVALTYAGVHDPSSGPAVNASVVNSKVDHYDDLTVAARDSDRLIAGGAMIAGSNKGGRRHRRDRHQQLDQCRNQQGRGPYPGFHQCERQCLSDCRRRR